MTPTSSSALGQRLFGVYRNNNSLLGRGTHAVTPASHPSPMPRATSAATFVEVAYREAPSLPHGRASQYANSKVRCPRPRLIAQIWRGTDHINIPFWATKPADMIDKWQLFPASAVKPPTPLGKLSSCGFL